MSVELKHTIEHRKAQGIFYTPKFLADFLAKQVCKLANSYTKVLDPACGDAILLYAVSKELPFISNSTLFGIDLDIRALEEAKKRFDSLDTTCCFIKSDGLFPCDSELISCKSWERFNSSIGITDGYDIIVSNPPWGADLKHYTNLQLKNSFKVAQGQYNSYDLFVQSIVNNLKVGGVYGIIIPDSIFNKVHTPLRELLYSETTIHLIARLGEKIFHGINRSCAVIVGVKEKPKIDHEVRCLKLSYKKRNQVLNFEKTLEDVLEKDGHFVHYRRFEENNDFLFDIDLKEKEHRIVKKLEKTGRSIKDYVTNSRGAEISKKGLVCQCSNCLKWMPLPKSNKPRCQHCSKSFILDMATKTSIVLSHNGKENIKFKSGEDLFRFTSRSKSWINTTKEGINYKSSQLYTGSKILVRKTGVGITASIDYENSITNQVVYILRVKSELKSKISNEIILAILNSRAMTYYLLKKYGETEWRSHPYLTQSTLKNLPFPVLNNHIDKYKKETINLTEEIKNFIKGSKEVNINKELDIKIERLVAKLFNLTKNDYNMIFSSLIKAEQLIPIRRLLNCSVNEIFEDGV